MCNKLPGDAGAVGCTLDHTLSSKVLGEGKEGDIILLLLAMCKTSC